MLDIWLKAGILEDETLSYPEEGTPQGGIVSPLLSNIYLHYVLDEWFSEVIQPRLKGRSFIVRYADLSISVTKLRGTVCGKSARTGLWGSGEVMSRSIRTRNSFLSLAG